VLFGGVEYPGGYISNELWILNLNSLMWTEIQPTGQWPPPTRCNYATYWPETRKMVMFGGRNYDERYNTTWTLDLATHSWDLLDYYNVPPSPREGSPILIIQGTSIMFVFGGWIQNQGYCNELWTLDLSTGLWTQYFPDPPRPIARGYCPLIYDKQNNRALLFSGYSDYGGQGINDLWQVSLESLQFAELFPTGSIPSQRGRFTTVIGGFAGHKATIFGGGNNYQQFFNEVYFLDWDTTVKLENENHLPTAHFLISCYPNPFNGSVNIDLNMKQSGFVTLSVYNLRGQNVAILADGSMSAGEHRIAWDGSRFPSGVYFARLEAAGSSKSIKMMLLK
jgi:hypothetical protein